MKSLHARTIAASIALDRKVTKTLSNCQGIPSGKYPPPLITATLKLNFFSRASNFLEGFPLRSPELARMKEFFFQKGGIFQRVSPDGGERECQSPAEGSGHVFPVCKQPQGVKDVMKVCSAVL